MLVNGGGALACIAHLGHQHLEDRVLPGIRLNEHISGISKDDSTCVSSTKQVFQIWLVQRIPAAWHSIAFENAMMGMETAPAQRGGLLIAW